MAFQFWTCVLRLICWWFGIGDLGVLNSGFVCGGLGFDALMLLLC